MTNSRPFAERLSLSHVGRYRSLIKHCYGHGADGCYCGLMVDSPPPHDAPTATGPAPLPDHGLGPGERAVALVGFRYVERLFLITITLMTLAAAAIEVNRVILVSTVNLADILLMFLYLEVIGMIMVFYGGRESPFVYPIFIAITALARLIVLQGKAMAPETIVFEASAILLLAIAAVIIARTSR